MTQAAKLKAVIHIEHNPQTGKIRPFELYFTVESDKKQFCGSYATEASAKAKAKKTADRNADWYDVTLAI